MIEKFRPVIAILREHLGMSISVFVHIFIFLFLLISVPHCKHKSPPQVIISVDLLPIAKKTSVENKDITENKKKEEKISPKEKPIEEKKTEIMPVKEENIKPKIEEISEKEKKDEIVKKESKIKQDKNKQVSKPKVSDIKKEQKKTKPKVSEYDALLKNLEDTVKQNDQKEKVDKKSKGPTEVGMPLSMSVKDSIKKQIEQCWNPPAGNKDAAQLNVLLHISFKQDGTVANVRIIDNTRYIGDELYQVAADAAVRAVYKCSPLQDLPIDQYSMWKNLEFNFDPSDLIY